MKNNTKSSLNTGNLYLILRYIKKYKLEYGFKIIDSAGVLNLVYKRYIISIL